MKDDQKRGRPKIADEQALRSCVTVSLPAPVHDRLIAMAVQRQTSVSSLVRLMILSHQRS